MQWSVLKISTPIYHGMSGVSLVVPFKPTIKKQTPTFMSGLWLKYLDCVYEVFTFFPSYPNTIMKKAAVTSVIIAETKYTNIGLYAGIPKKLANA